MAPNLRRLVRKQFSQPYLRDMVEHQRIEID
jgi:hypothetical protein